MLVGSVMRIETKQDRDVAVNLCFCLSLLRLDDVAVMFGIESSNNRFVVLNLHGRKISGCDHKTDVSFTS
jgi:hypothetical protein